jgi:hypothetical protein
MRLRLGTIAPLASIAITFLSNAVGSCPAGTRHFLRLLNILFEFGLQKYVFFQFI